MKNIFDSTPRTKLPRNRFNLTHSKKMSFNQGELIPIMCKEAVPGDSFQGSHEVLVRCAPLVSPAYTRMRVKCETFFVPKRLLWDEFETWITGGPDGEDVPTHPYFDQGDLTSTAYALMEQGTLWDYMGLPCIAGPSAPSWAPKVSVLPFRALAMIWNEWYRVPELFDPIMFDKSSGAQGATAALQLLTLQRRCWERDYYTSCQPRAQRGAAAAAPIDLAYSANSLVQKDGGANPAVDSPLTTVGGVLHTNAGADPSRISNIESASLLVEKFRIASAVQKFLEAMSRGGSRLTEYIWQIFGRRSPDARLQRPEFLGGSSGNVMVSEVLSTVQFEGASDELPQGNMAGHGIHVGRGGNWRYTAPEHGFFISLMSVVPEGGQYGAGLYSGIEKMWQRFDKFDEYIPMFANLGEQAVKVSELSNNMDNAGAQANADLVFGYAPRYSEYKWAASTVHGDFRTTLDFWHQNRGWVPTGNPLDGPVLNSNFLTVNNAADALDRIFAVTDPDSDKLWCMAINHLSAVRPMPYHATPS